MNTTPHSYNSQCSYSGQIAAGTYHVLCNVLQELGPAFSSRRLSRLSDGVLLVKDGSTKETSTEKGREWEIFRKMMEEYFSDKNEGFLIYIKKKHNHF